MVSSDKFFRCGLSWSLPPFYRSQDRWFAAVVLLDFFLCRNERFFREQDISALILSFFVFVDMAVLTHSLKGVFDDLILFRIEGDDNKATFGI